MQQISEFKKCKCGYDIIMYTLKSEHGITPDMYRYFDGHSGNHEQIYVCPSCKDRLDYRTLLGL